ncbi:MAG: hypothetical protein ABI759_21220 [Candidatus Solibacter sp.]
MRVALLLGLSSVVAAQQTSPAERLIATGHWKRARTLVEKQLRDNPEDPLANFLLSQIRAAFGDRTSPLPLAEKAVALDGRTAKYRRQLAEVLGLTAQHAGPFQLVGLGRRFRRELNAALALDAKDVQALRDLVEFYLIAPGLIGGSVRDAIATATRIEEIDPAEGALARARVAAYQKDSTREKTFLRKAVALSPSAYKPQIALAQFYLEVSHQDLKDAEEEAQEGVRIDPTRVDAHAILAAVYATKKAWASLDATLAAAQSAVPDGATPFYRAAEKLIADASDIARAERYLRIYIAAEPEGNQPALEDARRLLAQSLGTPAATPRRASPVGQL